MAKATHLASEVVAVDDVEFGARRDLHERYGIVQHTTDLGQKFVDAGYVTIVPDFFSRFTGDREALALPRRRRTWADWAFDFGMAGVSP